MKQEYEKPDFPPVSEAVVLAGGLGTRLQSIVTEVPKPMAPVAGRPFLCYLLDQLVGQGLARVILSVGYRSQAISGYFGNHYRGMAIDYAVETEPLGTGGGLAAALERAAGPYVLTMNGDSFLRFDLTILARMLRGAEPGALAVAVCEVSDAGRYGTVELAEGRIQRFLAAGVPGPGLINAGVYLLTRDLFWRYPMPARFSFEADFLQARIDELRPVAAIFRGSFIDIGIPSAFADAQTLLPLWTKA